MNRKLWITAAVLAAASILVFGARKLETRARNAETAARCAPQFAIDPQRVMVGRVERSPEGGMYWDIQLTHTGAESLPVYWYGSADPELLPRDPRIIKIASGDKVTVTSKHKASGPMSMSMGNWGYAFMSRQQRQAMKKPVRLQYPLRVDSEITQSIHGVDAQSLRHPENDLYAVDIVAPFGADLVAGVQGVVALTESRYPDSFCDDIRAGTRGNHVVIVTDNNYQVTYGHLQQNSVVVKLGQEVMAGDPIAKVGASGAAYRAHLHMEVAAITDEGYETLPVELVDADGQPIDLHPGTVVKTR